MSSIKTEKQFLRLISWYYCIFLWLVMLTNKSQITILYASYQNWKVTHSVFILIVIIPEKLLLGPLGQSSRSKIFGDRWTASWTSLTFNPARVILSKINFSMIRNLERKKLRLEVLPVMGNSRNLKSSPPGRTFKPLQLASTKTDKQIQ